LRAGVRFGKVVLGDIEEALRYKLEGPERGKPEAQALEVDDDECLAYWPTAVATGSWGDLGKLPHCCPPTAMGFLVGCGDGEGKGVESGVPEPLLLAGGQRVAIAVEST